MTTQNYTSFFLPQYRNLSHHAIEATVSILGITNPALRQHLVNELDSSDNQSGFMGDPVFDVLFPWQSSGLDTSTIDYLHPKTRQVIAQDIATPYQHQYHAWQTLTNSKQVNSAVITSGTGSGKTECFLVPILDDLVRLHENSGQSLTGVHALFLYPLNALINSQKTRLDRWTAPFGQDIRYCLYNGSTPDTHKESKANEVQGRERLRKDPPPILLTNTTMLEYMLIRHNDAPILRHSQGKLRWLVLDEAHSYTGSTATEMSLLLRRVMLAFGVKPEQVHFIATSATIGNDKQTNAKLTEFLANLTGAPIDNIHIIGAHRDVPSLPVVANNTLSKEELLHIDQGEKISQSRFDSLCGHPLAQSIRKCFIQDKNGNNRIQARSLGNLIDHHKLIGVFGHLPSKTQKYEMLDWLDLLSNTKPTKNAPAFLPLRGHLFGRSLMGLYACANPNCQGKHNTPLANKDINGKPYWEFGYVYTDKYTHCRHCHFPVFEMRFCNECNTPHLVAHEEVATTTKNRHLITPKLSYMDDFSLSEEVADDSSQEEGGKNSAEEGKDNPLKSHQPNLDSHLTILMPLEKSKQLYSLDKSKPVHEIRYLNQHAEIYSKPQANCIEVATKYYDGSQPLSICSFCHGRNYRTDQIRGAYLGAPFYISESIPTLLDFCPSNSSNRQLPYHGKRMISFTDSRQGTARITIKIRQDSTKRQIRSKVYHILASKKPSPDALAKKQEEIKVQQAYIAQLAPLVSTGRLPSDILQSHQKTIQQLEQEMIPTPERWSDVRDKITQDSNFRHLERSFEKVLRTNPNLDIAHISLLNEFAKRPKKQPSLETMGLVHISYPRLKDITVDHFKTWGELGLTTQDWQDYLKLLLDFFVRERGCIPVSQDENHVTSNVYAANRELYLSIGSIDLDGKTHSKIVQWLSASNTKNRLVKLLCLATHLDPMNNQDKDKISQILVQAWEDLKTAGYLSSGGKGLLDQPMYQLNLKNTELALTSSAFVCPITHRLLETTFKGFTPYIPYALNLDELRKNKEVYQCQHYDIPIFTPNNDNEPISQQARHWIDTNKQVANLRELGLWTDIADAVILGSNVIATEEHSAQISANQLQEYEKKFNNSEINLLNCSTTMEMGVDIEGISSVIMNNVPPHPTNYLQRTGRAGRRGESQAIAFTLCKHNPHEQHVFNQTLWAFNAAINPASINFSSQRILQSHINALLIARILQQQDGSITLTIGSFFLGTTKDIASNTLECEKFIKRLTDYNLASPTNINNLIQTGIFDDTLYLIARTELSKLKNAPSQKNGADAYTNSIDMGINSLLVRSPYANQSPTTFINDCIKALDQACLFFVSKILSKASLYAEAELGYRKKLIIDIRHILKDHLLGSLSRIGFLPRHGFPSGLVEFNTRHNNELKNPKNIDKDSEKEGNPFLLLGNKAIRDISIALHEYSPGNQVVVDGLVYKSAGIELNHYIHTKNNTQKIASYARCPHCGALNYDEDTLDECHSCHKHLPLACQHRYLEPVGFSVDYYAQPTTKIEHLSYVPAEEPLIQANSMITPLFHPQLGSYRTDSNGAILYHNKGEYGNGFFVCLRCGRAKPAPSGNDIDIEQARMNFSKTHTPLHPTNNQPKSKGSCHDSAYTVQHVHLAATDKTDIFELYLINPKTQKYFKHSKEDAQDAKMLETLIVALKEALAHQLGIDSQEIGAGIKPIHIHKQNALAAYLYDKAGGGAGFASNAHLYLIDLFKHARDILDCHKNCSHACEYCLVNHDTRFIADRLDRKLALDYLDSISNYLELPKEAALFSGAQYCPVSIAERVAQALTRYDNITLYLQGDIKEWALLNALDKKIELWAHNQKTVNIAIEKSILNQLKTTTNSSSLIYLSFLHYDHRFNLHIWQKTPDTKNIILQLFDAHTVLTLGTTDTKNAIPNDSYWGHSAIIVESSEPQLLPLTPFNVEQHLTSHHSRRISTKALQDDIALTDFGSVFWRFVLEHSPELKNKFASLNLVSIIYNDRYACISPQVVLLLQQLLHGLCQYSAEAWQKIDITIETEKPKNRTDSNPTKPSHNWKGELPTKAIKDFLCQTLTLNQRQISLNIEQSVPHDRTIRLKWSDGSLSLVDIGWGLGFLALSSKDNKFQFDGDIQAELDQYANAVHQKVIKQKKFGSKQNTYIFITPNYQP